MEGDKEQKTNASVVVEASSTTPGEEVVTKRSLRVQTWRKIQETKCGVGYNMIFNKIPNFVGNEKAANLLTEIDEFKKAKNIKVNFDRSQDAVKIQILSTDKTLYLPPSKESNALFTQIVDCPIDADEQTKKKIIKVSNLKENPNRKEINLDDKVKLDMIVIGSVCVSRDGYRIGKGNGFVDLDVGILTHAGVITPETVIVTTVHDHQVTDSLPLNLFQKYDTPVDIIVTPTEVIRVSKRLSRPTGIIWELLSERRLRIVPVLQKIKENEEKNGKVIILKSEDTDIESNARTRKNEQRYRRYGRYRNRPPKSQINNDESNKEENNSRPQRPRLRKRLNRRRRTTNKSEGEQSSGENKENNQNQRRGGGGGGGGGGRGGAGDRGDDNRKKNDQKRRRGNRDFCVRVSNISKSTRIKDLKAELRKRECIPVHISWKGTFGRCFLYYAKREGNEIEIEIEKVINSLGNLSVEVLEGEETKTVPLDVELFKFEEKNTNNRIESVDTTSV